MYIYCAPLFHQRRNKNIFSFCGKWIVSAVHYSEDDCPRRKTKLTRQAIQPRGQCVHGHIAISYMPQVSFMSLVQCLKGPCGDLNSCVHFTKRNTRLKALNQPFSPAGNDAACAKVCCGTDSSAGCDWPGILHFSANREINGILIHAIMFIFSSRIQKHSVLGSKCCPFVFATSVWILPESIWSQLPRFCDFFFTFLLQET